MLRVLLFVFNHLQKGLASYQEKQQAAIKETEQVLKDQKADLSTAEKLVKKLEL